MKWFVGMRDIEERWCAAFCPSPHQQARQAGTRWRAGCGPLAPTQGKAAPSLLSACAKWGTGRFKKLAGRARNMAEAGRDGAQQRACGKNPLAIMPASTLLGCRPGPVCGQLVQQPRGSGPPSPAWHPAGSAGPAAGQGLLAIQGSGQNGARPIKGSMRWQPCGFSGNVL